MSGAVTTRTEEDRAVLYLALELGQKEWKLGFATGMGRRPRERVVGGGDFEALEEEIDLAEPVPVSWTSRRPCQAALGVSS